MIEQVFWIPKGTTLYRVSNDKNPRAYYSNVSNALLSYIVSNYAPLRLNLVKESIIVELETYELIDPIKISYSGENTQAKIDISEIKGKLLYYRDGLVVPYNFNKSYYNDTKIILKDEDSIRIISRGIINLNDIVKLMTDVRCEMQNIDEKIDINVVSDNVKAYIEKDLNKYLYFERSESEYQNIPLQVLKNTVKHLNLIGLARLCSTDKYIKLKCDESLYNIYFTDHIPFFDNQYVYNGRIENYLGEMDDYDIKYPIKSILCKEDYFTFRKQGLSIKDFLKLNLVLNSIFYTVARIMVYAGSKIISEDMEYIQITNSEIMMSPKEEIDFIRPDENYNPKIYYLTMRSGYAMRVSNIQKTLDIQLARDRRTVINKIIKVIRYLVMDMKLLYIKGSKW